VFLPGFVREVKGILQISHGLFLFLFNLVPGNKAETGHVILPRFLAILFVNADSDSECYIWTASDCIFSPTSRNLYLATRNLNHHCVSSLFASKVKILIIWEGQKVGS